LFNAQIEPILTYGAEVWGLENVSQIEKVHTFAVKRFLGVPLHSSNKMIYGETGRYPLFITTAIKCIKYWIRIVRLPSSRLCRQAYEMLLIQLEAGNNNWASSVKKTLTENGFGIVWMCQGVGYEEGFISEFKDRLISCYKQNWHSEIVYNDKYSWYYAFKDVFEPEKYLTLITNKQMRATLAKFRLRVHGLGTAKHWFNNLEEYPSCPLCGQNVDDEVHLIFQCQVFSDIRLKYSFFRMTHIQPTMNGIKALLATHNDTTIIALSKYLLETMNRRTKKLEHDETNVVI
jgi:hypothetical protein